MTHTPREQPDSSPARRETDTERNDPQLPRTGEERIKRMTQIVKSIITAKGYDLHLRSAVPIEEPDRRLR